MMGLATAAACMLLGVNSSEAAATLRFEQVGANVTATWGGIYDLPSAPTTVYGSATSGAVFGSGYALAYGNRSQTPAGNLSGVSYPQGSAGPFFAPSYVGDTFGFYSNELYYPSGATGTFAPTGTMTFTGKTLAEMGASSFDNTLAYLGTGSVDGSREIRLSTVPEASTSLGLLALGAGGLTLRRRLKRAA